MATYAIGDVQGCMTTLERLLARIQYDRRHDRLWLAGDLVNRGPRSLDVLRWAAGQGDRVVAVMGNHDLHLLLRAAGLRERKKRDTIEDIVRAPDADELCAWVRARPLVHHEAPYLLVHGGLWPGWSVGDARRLSDEVAASLRKNDALLEALADGVRDVTWDERLTGTARVHAATVLMTTLRMLDRDGEPLHYSGPPDEAPKGAVPWFDAPRRRSADATVLFGHWAALGFVLRPPRYIALDSGCVWGRALTAVRLDDLAVFQEPAADGASED
jgi:bis(5'-nucleosyl)-tetraphosphatase (symmetrical)